MTMMALGDFRFDVRNIPMHRMERTLPIRHGPVKVQGRRPSLHHMGTDVEEVTIRATLYPHFLGGQGLEQYEGMRRAAMLGNPLTLAVVSGKVEGRFVIRELRDRSEYFKPDGSAQKIEVTIRLAAVPRQMGASDFLSAVGRLF
ncbi:MAG: phage tail protein [Devosia sp.]